MHDLNVDVVADEYGRFKVTESYLLTAHNEDAVLSCYLNNNMKPEARVSDLVLTVDGEPREVSLGSALVGLSDQIGKQTTVVLAYTMSFKVIERDAAQPFRFELADMESFALVRFENVKIRLTLPADPVNLTSFNGRFGVDYLTKEVALADQSKPNLMVTTKVDGAYVATNAERLPANEAFGIELTMPEGALKRLPGVNDIALPAAALLLLLAIIITSMVLGSKEKRLKTKEEAYAPDGLNPAEVGFAIAGEADGEDIAALVFYWASHGHLTSRRVQNLFYFAFVELSLKKTVEFIPVIYYNTLRRYSCRRRKL